MKRIYLVRHCKATGQEPDAQLTDDGIQQAYQLAEFFKDMGIEYIVSSPFARAIHTIKPLSDYSNREIHIDDRLQERVLSTAQLNNWMDLLEQTYSDFDLKFEGGESSNEAAGRALQVIKEMIERPEQNIVVVTHGALLSLIINQYDRAFGFEGWKRLTNPDVYKLEIEHHDARINRVWI